MSSESESLREDLAQRKAAGVAKTQAGARRRQRPSESLHDDDNKRLHEDNNSEHIAIDLHGIDLTTDATEWRRFTKLDAPDPLPGYTQRWVRVRMAGKNDASNVYRKVREGWRPRAPGSIPGDGHLLPTIQLGQFGECIGVEDSILMHMPLKVFNQMRKHYRDRRKAQTAATETSLEDLSERHNVPLSKRKVTTVGRTPKVAADD